MAKSLLGSFVTGTRAMLAAQLIISVGAVGLAGWTLGVTNELIRERDRLQERVIQLEENIASRGDVPPPSTAVVEPRTPQATDYPGSIEGASAPEAVDEQGAGATPDASGEPGESRADRTEEPIADPEPGNDLSRVLGSLFAPAPPLRTVVLHVRSETDSSYATRIARELMAGGEVRVLIDVMPPRDPRQSGYAYFDGRQSRPAAEMVTRFHDIARNYQIAAWSAQLRGIALPAQGEYTADRLDLVLPPLPAADPQRIDPRQLQLQRVEPQVTPVP